MLLVRTLRCGGQQLSHSTPNEVAILASIEILRDVQLKLAFSFCCAPFNATETKYVLTHKDVVPSNIRWAKLAEHDDSGRTLSKQSNCSTIIVYETRNSKFPSLNATTHFDYCLSCSHVFGVKHDERLLSQKPNSHEYTSHRMLCSAA